jgi:23S rRNA-intervening sequence protein
MHLPLSNCTSRCLCPEKKFKFSATNCFVPVLRSRPIAVKHRGRSDAEFCSKLDAALQEADESALWLELLRDDCGITAKQLTDLIAETDELISIFVTVNRTKRRRT